MPTDAAILDALRVVRDPDLHKDIVALGFVKNVKIDGRPVAFTIELTTPGVSGQGPDARSGARGGARRSPGVTDVDIEMTAQVRAVPRPELGRQPVEGVKNIIAVGAGKGGVGKTTVAVNLAVALAARGSRVALLDGDMYGPNVPIMLGLKTQLETDGQKIVPAERYGMQVVSMGFLTQDDAPVIWRGPMLHGAMQQFFRDVRWNDVDYLHRRHAAGHGRHRAEPEPVGAGGRRGAGDDAADRSRWPTRGARCRCTASSTSRRSACSRT